MEVQADSSLRSAAMYWNATAETYEARFSGTTVEKIRRKSVWADLGRAFSSGARVLEINCGTEIDAIFLAHRGVRVLVCDLSPQMIELARELAAHHLLSHVTDFRVLANEQLAFGNHIFLWRR
jgi:2-polyprenyl-3-methyl-5-hydroxy-6-metoxy-1,4-benzoquinol methylase